MSTDLDGAVRFFRDLQARKRPTPIARHSTVRVSGVLLGVAVAVVFTVVDRLTDSDLALPAAGSPAAGWLGAILLAVLVGGLLGLVCAWPRNGPTGIATASLGIALVLGAAPWLAAGLLGGLHTEIMVMVCAPLGVVCFFLISILPMSLLRWAATVQGELFDRPWWTWRRIRLPVALLVLAAVVAV